VELSLNYIRLRIFGLGLCFDLRESPEATLRQMIDNEPRAFRLTQSIEDAVHDTPDDDRRDGHHGVWQVALFEIGEDFLVAAVFAEFVPREHQLDAGEILAPLVVEGSVPSATVRHPEAATLKHNAVRCAHMPTPADFRPRRTKPARLATEDFCRERPG
jgi:hypothetical protein